MKKKKKKKKQIIGLKTNGIHYHSINAIEGMRRRHINR